MPKRKQEANTRPAHSWTLDKLDFLEAYMPAFLTACNKAQNTCYVDGFAGPGINKDEITGVIRNGSPLIALNAVGKPPKETKFSTLHFIESVPSVLTSLRQHVEAHPEQSRVHIHEADFNKVLPSILNGIHRLTPTLFLLDPDDMSLEWQSVKLIGARERADIFMLVSASGVSRNVNNPAVHSRITKFFGSEIWRTVKDQLEGGDMPGISGFSAFLELYAEQLRTLGFTTADQQIIARNSKNAAMHGLVFASKHSAGINIGNNVLDGIVQRGQQPLGF
jgi:three-Cys-motif partner protein